MAAATKAQESARKMQVAPFGVRLEAIWEYLMYRLARRLGIVHR